MRSRRIGSVTEFLDAESTSWSSIRTESITLMPTPLGLQPKPYITTSWKDQPYGLTKQLSVACVHDDMQMAFRLQWNSATQTMAQGESFPDGAAIALPVRGDPPLMLMGAESAPIHILQWQAGVPELRSVLISGIGSSRPGPAVRAIANARWAENSWTLVVTRDLRSGGDIAPLEAGKPTRVGFAIWNGANSERAGIKAVSVDWVALAIDS